MSVYRKTGTKVYTVAVPTRTGTVKRSTGTTDRGTARAMERMLEELGPRGRREWWALDLLVANRFTVAEVFDWYRRNDLDGLRTALDDVNIEPHVADWRVRLADRVAAETAGKYEFYVRSLIAEGAPFPRSRFTVDTIELWLGAYPAGRSTKRKAHTAMSVFAADLVRRKVIPTNPLRSIEMPKAAAPRLRWLEVAEMLRLARGHDDPRHAALSALVHGSGIEISVAIALKRRDVDMKRREIRAAGTKTHSRDRIVRVANWAWDEFVAPYCATLLPNAPLFPGLDRWTATDIHRATCTRLEIQDYQFKDSRHSYAVRAARAGTPAELIARQLGHVNAVLVLKVYGRFMPSQQDRDRWEERASEQDALALGGGA